MFNSYSNSFKNKYWCKASHLPLFQGLYLGFESDFFPSSASFHILMMLFVDACPTRFELRIGISSASLLHRSWRLFPLQQLHHIHQVGKLWIFPNCFQRLPLRQRWHEQATCYLRLQWPLYTYAWQSAIGIVTNVNWGGYRILWKNSQLTPFWGSQGLRLSAFVR